MKQKNLLVLLGFFICTKVIWATNNENFTLKVKDLEGRTIQIQVSEKSTNDDLIKAYRKVTGINDVEGRFVIFGKEILGKRSIGSYVKKKSI